MYAAQSMTSGTDSSTFKHLTCFQGLSLKNAKIQEFQLSVTHGNPVTFTCAGYNIRPK